MKKLLVLSVMFLCFGAFAQDACEFEGACDGQFLTQKADINPDYTSDCDLSDPDCPLPQGVANYSSEKENKALYFLCISVNPRVRRYGIFFGGNRILSALGAYNRCRQASGIFFFLCQRPQCAAISF